MCSSCKDSLFECILLLTIQKDILLLRVIALFGDRRGINGLVYTLFFFSYGICIAAAIICIVSMRRKCLLWIQLANMLRDLKVAWDITWISAVYVVSQEIKYGSLLS